MDQQLADYVSTRWPALLRYATVVCGDPNEGEELVQAALVKVAARWRLLRNRHDIDAYVRTAIIRGHLNLRHRLRRHEERRAQPPVVVVPDASDSVTRSMDIRRALAALPPRQRAVLALRYLDDLTEAQAAEMLGCSVGTVKSQSSKAIATLRERFPELDEQEVSL